MAIDPNIGKDTQFQTGEEQAKIASRGGKASGAARKRKKTFREELMALLPMTDLGKDNQPIINPITGRKQSIQQTITMQLLLKARKGDIKATKLILEALGERLLKTEGTQDITVHNRFESMTDEELDKEIKRMKGITGDV